MKERPSTTSKHRVPLVIIQAWHSHAMAACPTDSFRWIAASRPPWFAWAYGVEPDIYQLPAAWFALTRSSVGTMSNRSVQLRAYSLLPSLAARTVIPEEEPLAPHSAEEATDDGEDMLHDGHGVSLIPGDTTQPEWDDGIPVSRSWWAFLIRALALLCAMSLSIGSHLCVPNIRPLFY